MSKDSYEGMIRQIQEAQMQLKIRLEQVSRLRIDCAKLQLELLRLYRPQCLEILEMLRDVSAPADPAFGDSGGDAIESRDNDQAEQAPEVEAARHGIPIGSRLSPRDRPLSPPVGDARTPPRDPRPAMMRYTETEQPMAAEQSYAQQLNEMSASNGEQQSPATVSSSAATQTMELHENAPIVHASTTVITRQPGESESRFPRRPIPISTLDWISTPRTQLNAISGTQFLEGVEQLEIQQVIDLSTLLGRTEKGTQYRVKVPRAETLFLAMESKSETQSRLYGWYKGFVLNVLDQCGETAFIIRKDPSWMHVPCSRQKITVESANLIGSVEQNFSLVGPSFTVYDASGIPLCNISGPNVSGCCMYKEAQFQVISLDGSRQVASLMHQWDHLAVDYILLLTFPLDTDVKLKSLLLGASFLIEYLFFQRIRRASRR